MPKKAYLEKYHSSEELKKKYLNSNDSVESLVMAFTLETILGMVAQKQCGRCGD